MLVCIFLVFLPFALAIVARVLSATPHVALLLPAVGVVATAGYMLHVAI